MLPEINEAAVWAIFFLPVVALVVIAVATYPMRRLSGYVAIAAVFGSWLLSLWALDTALQADGHVVGFAPHRWLEFGPLSFAVQARLDGLTAVMLIVVSGASMGYMALSNTMLNLIVPNELRGRVMSVYMLYRGLMPLGSLFAGAVAGAWSAPAALTLMGAMGLLLSAGFVLVFPNLRRLA